MARYTWAKVVGTRNAKHSRSPGVHFDVPPLVIVPSRFPNSIGAARAAFTGAKYATGFAGRMGVLPSSVSPTAEIVTDGANVVVVVAPTIVVVVDEVVVVAPGSVVVGESSGANVGTEEVVGPGPITFAAPIAAAPPTSTTTAPEAMKRRSDQPD